MTRLMVAIGLCIAIAGCSSAMTPSEQVSSPAPAVSVPSPDVRSPMPATQPPTRAPDASVGPGGVVAYGFDDAIWVVNADGTNAHELIPAVVGSPGPLAWSRDGSRLLYGTQRGVALTDAAGSEPVELELPCPPRADSDPVLSICRVDIGGVALSPDGTRLAYPVWEGTHDQANPDVASTLVVLEVWTGLVTRLESTRATTPSLACGNANSEGENHSPSWSPDGTRLVFARDVNRSNMGGACPQTVMTVDADGSNVRQILAPGQVQGLDQPIWSPDGASILIGAIFTSGSGAKEGWGGNIYAVRADGTSLTALASDGASVWPTWTRDGRIAFVRWLSPADRSGDPWVMDADGGNATRVEATIPSLTAAGCLVCAYPVQVDGSAPGIDPLNVRQLPLRKYETTTMLWQPVPGVQQ